MKIYLASMHNRNIYKRTQDLKHIAVIKYQLGSYFYVRTILDEMKEQMKEYDNREIKG